MKDYYIASISFGKDSLAMLLYLINSQKPLDEVVFYDTGVEFNAIYKLRDKVSPILNEHGIKYTELHPEKLFEWTMFEKPVNGKNGLHYGYSWCGGACRWGTTEKLKALDKYALKRSAVVYVGIAADEAHRTEGKADFKQFPLIENDMTEKDCLEYCRENGFDWLEKTQDGYVDLYDILDRVSCWCCANKNLKELKNIYRFLHEYWKRLERLQLKTHRPMKGYYDPKNKLRPKGVFELAERFEKELLQEDNQ